MQQIHGCFRRSMSPIFLSFNTAPHDAGAIGRRVMTAAMTIVTAILRTAETAVSATNGRSRKAR